MADPMQRTPMNPTDGAYMKATGQINPQMTVGQWLGTMGISPEDPITDAVQKIRGSLKGATPQGKMQQMAGAGAPPSAPPAGPPPAAPPTQGSPRSLRDEISNY